VQFAQVPAAQISPGLTALQSESMLQEDGVVQPALLQTWPVGHGLDVEEQGPHVPAGEQMLGVTQSCGSLQPAWHMFERSQTWPRGH
jgi:hypothetical protein